MNFGESVVIKLSNGATSMTMKSNDDIVSRRPSLVPRLSVGAGSMRCKEDTADMRKSLKVSAILEKLATHYYVLAQTEECCTVYIMYLLFVCNNNLLLH